MSEAKKSSPWIWISLGLIVGLFVAFILFLDQNIVKNSQRENPLEKNTGISTRPVFDFYTVLPERKMEIPAMPSDQPDVPNISNKKKASKGMYMLQAGSFKKQQDADRRKAELAFLGLQAKIKMATVKGSVFYRVEMGPLNESQSNKVQRTMITNNMDFLTKSIPSK